MAELAALAGLAKLAELAGLAGLAGLDRKIVQIEIRLSAKLVDCGSYKYLATIKFGKEHRFKRPGLNWMSEKAPHCHGGTEA